jgi:hypothetical protein
VFRTGADAAAGNVTPEKTFVTTGGFGTAKAGMGWGSITGSAIGAADGGAGTAAVRASGSRNAISGGGGGDCGGRLSEIISGAGRIGFGAGGSFVGGASIVTR